MKKVISLVGVRPQFIKETVVIQETCRGGALRYMVVRSVHHYDANISDIFFCMATDQQARLLWTVS